MKNVLLVIFAFFLVNTTALAQAALKLDREAEAHCTEVTRAMARELRLNELGYIKLKELNRERMIATQEVLRNYRNDTHLVEQELEKLALEYDQKLTSFLNPNQLQAYANYKKQPTKEATFIAASSKE